jgi:hypothetical protein
VDALKFEVKFIERVNSPAIFRFALRLKNAEPVFGGDKI